MESRTQNDIQKSFVILNLSDLHYPSKSPKENDVDEQKVFKMIFQEFTNALASFLNQNKKWTPSCLTLIGDIANRGKKEEYDHVKGFLDMLSRKIGQDSLLILPVPGNHDKFIPGGTQEFTDQHAKDVKEFMNAYQEYIKETRKKKTGTEKVSENKHLQAFDSYQATYFGPYSEFVRDYNQGIELPYVEGIPLSHNNITGIRIIESLKLCAVLLNTEWFYLPKQEVIRKLSVGDHFIQTMQNRVMRLREEGYFVITLMHRSPYYLDWTEIFDTALRESAFDRIVGMSDLILCGHEHNRQLKRPDFLLNTTQLFQNGTFYAQPNTINNKKNDRYECSASLLQIDPNKRTIQALRFNLEPEPGKYKWRIPNVNDAETFWLDSPRLPNRPMKIPPHNLYKTLILKYPVNSSYIETAIKQLFYPLDPVIKVPDIPSTIQVVIKNMDDEKSENVIHEAASALSETKKVCHLILYKEMGYTFQAPEKKEQMKAVTHYQEIKKYIRTQNLDHKIVSNFVFCNILY